jgi:hypothetical protein
MTLVFGRPVHGRRTATTTVLALAAAMLSLGVAAPANAVGNTIELEGTVTGIGGAPVEDFVVYAYDASTGDVIMDSSNLAVYTTTDAAGHYEFDNLPTSSVKLNFWDGSAFTFTSTLPYTSRWLGGATSMARATTVAVTEDPATPVTAPTLSLSERYGAVTGSLTADGRPGSDPNLILFGTALNVDDDSTQSQIATEGSSYRMLVSPGTVRPALEAIDFGSDPANPTYFIRKWWQNTYSQADATPVRVVSGQTVSGINFSLTKTLAATRSPQILGFPTVGRALTAAPGTWSQMANTQFSYTWLRGATVVGNGPSYVPTVADLHSRLTLRVTADADKYGWYHNSGQATATSAVVRHPATERVGAKAKAGRKVAMAVKLVSAKQSPVRGNVIVLRGSKIIKTGLHLVRGKVAFTLRHQPKGRHTYTVRYQGNKVLAKVQRSFTVRVHK